MTIEAIEAIEMAKAAYPKLCTDGMGEGMTAETFERSRNDFEPANVATAIAYLRQRRTVKHPRVSSYHLKHLAERWGRENGMQPYITNGELIVAAIYLGIKIKPAVFRSLNVAVGVRVDDGRG
jgi:hypothetical protein